ncbi:MAG: hypothetical protein WBS17_03040 [Candidatus Acidiferrales bacterium]
MGTRAFDFVAASFSSAPLIFPLRLKVERKPAFSAAIVGSALEFVDRSTGKLTPKFLVALRNFQCWTLIERRE